MLCARISAREEIQRFHVHAARVRTCTAHTHTQTHVSCRRRSIIYYYYFCSSLKVRRWISLVPVKHSLTARGYVLGIHLHTQKTAGRATISTTTTAAAGAEAAPTCTCGGRRGETFLHVLPRVRTMIIYKRIPIQVHGDDKSGAAAERGGDFAIGIRKISHVFFCRRRRSSPARSGEYTFVRSDNNNNVMASIVACSLRAFFMRSVIVTIAIISHLW